MPENKRFYWLKLQEDFFEDETIRYIEEQENGIKYSNFYLKLCLKSLRTNGKLIRLVGEMLIPYDVKSLASLTGVDVDTVRCAMALFEKIGCVKVLDSGELFISQLSELVGSETDKAKMMRRLRASEKVTLLPECYPDKEIEKEQDKDTKSKSERENICRKRPTRAFVPPTVEEVQAYCCEISASIDPSAFVDYYAAQGWVYGKAGKQMKDWKAAVRNWNRREKQNGGNNGNRTGIDQRSNGNDCPQNQPTKRLKNAFDYLDEIRAGANDSRPVEQTTGDIDWDELFGVP